VIKLLKKKQKKLSELAKPFAKYHNTGELCFKVANIPAALEKVKQAFKDGKQSYLDGVSVEYPDVWFVVRPSNTESVLKARIESKSEEKKEEVKQKILSLLSG
jgi:phosphomannomutase